MKKSWITTASLFICCLFTTSSAQQKVKVVDLNEDVKPAGCEQNNIILEGSNREAVNDALAFGKGEYIVLIARPGKKDKQNRSKQLLEQRLYTARAYLTDYLKLRGRETVVTSIALNNGSSYGVIEIYVTGQLYYVLASNPNFGIGLGSCDSPETDDKESRAKRALLYPWLYAGKKKQK